MLYTIGFKLLGYKQVKVKTKGSTCNCKRYLRIQTTSAKLLTVGRHSQSHVFSFNDAPLRQVFPWHSKNQGAILYKGCV